MHRGGGVCRPSRRRAVLHQNTAAVSSLTSGRIGQMLLRRARLFFFVWVGARQPGEGNWVSCVECRILHWVSRPDWSPKRLSSCPPPLQIGRGRLRRCPVMPHILLYHSWPVVKEVPFPDVSSRCPPAVRDIWSSTPAILNLLSIVLLLLIYGVPGDMRVASSVPPTPRLLSRAPRKEEQQSYLIWESLSLSHFGHSFGTSSTSEAPRDIVHFRNSGN